MGPVGGWGWGWGDELCVLPENKKLLLKETGKSRVSVACLNIKVLSQATIQVASDIIKLYQYN